jgi:hypothetical protein
LLGVSFKDVEADEMVLASRSIILKLERNLACKGLCGAGVTVAYTVKASRPGCLRAGARSYLRILPQWSTDRFGLVGVTRRASTMSGLERSSSSTKVGVTSSGISHAQAIMSVHISCGVRFTTVDLTGPRKVSVISRDGVEADIQMSFQYLIVRHTTDQLSS